ncbi:MAG TPA: nitrile hydratase accessory protein [Acidimicrobiia bacterium]|jgi:nitrile hydratase accessory protein
MNDLVQSEVQRMAGASALPRQNGELVFEAPWQGRMFGLALGVVRKLGLDWEEFRRRLIAAIDADPARQYYESWIAALDALVVDLGLASAEELEARAARIDR